MTAMKQIELCGQIVRVNENQMISLTDMWKASGGANKNQPYFFLENEGTKAFVNALNLKQGNPCLRRRLSLTAGFGGRRNYMRLKRFTSLSESMK